MSDYEEIDNEIKAKYGKQRKLGIDIKIDSETMKQEITKNMKLEEELENITTEKESLESKLKILAEKKLSEKRDYFRGLGYSGSLESFEDVRNAREWEQSRDPIGRGGSGNLRLNSAQTGEKEGFDSQENMIDYLVDLKNTSRNPQQRKKAEEILDVFYKKTFDAMKRNEIKQGEIFEDKPKERGESIIMKAVRLDNERLRKKALERREK